MLSYLEKKSLQIELNPGLAGWVLDPMMSAFIGDRGHREEGHMKL